MSWGKRWQNLPGEVADAANPVKGKHALYNRRIIVWACLSCWHHHSKPVDPDHPMKAKGPGFVRVEARPEVCVACGQLKIEKFDSMREAKYGAEMRGLEKEGLIRDLDFHPEYRVPFDRVTPEGKPGCIVYVPDGRYRSLTVPGIGHNNPPLVVYDVKPRPARDKSGRYRYDKDFELRRRTVETAHGITVTIIHYDR